MLLCLSGTLLLLIFPSTPFRAVQTMLPDSVVDGCQYRIDVVIWLGRKVA